MIDSHCHMEQTDFQKDRDEVIQKCKKEGLKAVVTSCAHPRDFDLTVKMVQQHKNFVFAAAAVHPEYVKEISEQEIENFIEKIKENRKHFVAIGESGLDYFWVKELSWQEKQKDLFVQFIELAKELKLPLVIHARDAFEETIKILEQNDAKEVCMHMFGANQLVQNIIDNNWLVSMNTIVLRSKKHRKIARDMPIEQLLLETDAPWLGPKGERNDPTSIKIVAQEIAEIKKLGFENVWKACGQNAVKFFRLPVKI